MADKELEKRVERLEKTLGTLIGWLQVELGEHNCKALLDVLYPPEVVVHSHKLKVGPESKAVLGPDDKLPKEWSDKQIMSPSTDDILNEDPIPQWASDLIKIGWNIARNCNSQEEAVNRLHTTIIEIETVNGRKAPEGKCPDWAIGEMANTYKVLSRTGGISQLESFSIFGRMVDRLGYGRTDNNPSLTPIPVDD
jgi:hypothetical protein